MTFACAACADMMYELKGGVSRCSAARDADRISNIQHYLVRGDYLYLFFFNLYRKKSWRDACLKPDRARYDVRAFSRRRRWRPSNKYTDGVCLQADKVFSRGLGRARSEFPETRRRREQCTVPTIDRVSNPFLFDASIIT